MAVRVRRLLLLWLVRAGRRASRGGRLAGRDARLGEKLLQLLLQVGHDLAARVDAAWRLHGRSLTLRRGLMRAGLLRGGRGDGRGRVALLEMLEEDLLRRLGACEPLHPMRTRPVSHPVPETHQSLRQRTRVHPAPRARRIRTHGVRRELCQQVGQVGRLVSAGCIPARPVQPARILRRAREARRVAREKVMQGRERRVEEGVVCVVRSETARGSGRRVCARAVVHRSARPVLLLLLRPCKASPTRCAAVPGCGGREQGELADEDKER